MRVEVFVLLLLCAFLSNAQSTSTVSSTAKAVRSLDLKLRGGATLQLPDTFVHSVVLGLVANSAAIIACNDLYLQRDGKRPLWYIYLHNMVVTFGVYMLIFFFTGFVPMGYVPNAKPIIKTFGER